MSDSCITLEIYQDKAIEYMIELVSSLYPQFERQSESLPPQLERQKHVFFERFENGDHEVLPQYHLQGQATYLTAIQFLQNCE